jgi:hypothetical protein
MMERTLLILRIALRNIRRQLRRSLLTASAMVIGIGLLMFVRALEGGAHVMYVESAVRLGAGHIAVEHPEYAASQDLVHRLGFAVALLERGARQPHPDRNRIDAGIGDRPGECIGKIA